MDEKEWLAERFEEKRIHLRAVAYRMLGSPARRMTPYRNPGFGSAVPARAESRTWADGSRPWSPGCASTCGGRASRGARSRCARTHPTRSAIVRPGPTPNTKRCWPIRSVSRCSWSSRRSLRPERLAFVLHDMFAVPFDEIAPIVGRSPTAARQLASRARRRVQGAATVPAADPLRQREIVDAFLAASRGGDFAARLAVLDPDVVLRSDRPAVLSGASRRSRCDGGRRDVLWARPRAGKIVAIDMVADPERLRELDVVMLGG
jgi:hypothetical protein